jgi:ribosomal protein L31
MKKVHPENYRLVAFKDMSNEDVFITKSAAMKQLQLMVLNTQL